MNSIPSNQSRLLFAIIPFLLVGCSFIKPRGDLSLDDQKRLIHDTAQTAISIGINEIYKDDDAKKVERASELKQSVDENILNGILLTSDTTVDQVTIQLLMKKIPPQYALYLQSALTLFQVYFETPEVGEILSDRNRQLFVSLFQGVSDGCQLVIDLYSE